MASFNFNKAIIAGRITDDPVLQTKEGRDPVTYFDVAIVRKRGGRNGEIVTDFPRVVAWGKNAEFVCENFKKDDCVCVVGNIRTRTHTNNGVKGFSTEIVADEILEVDAQLAEDEVFRRIGDSDISVIYQ